MNDQETFEDSEDFEIEDFIEDDPADWKATMTCQKHISCINLQGWASGVYEALSSYDKSELSEEQRKFLDWIDYF